MKAEHRKELQTNLLADRLGRAMRDFKASSNTTAIVVCIAVVAVVALAAGWHFYQQAERQTSSTLWVKVNNASSPEDLQAIAKDHPGTMPARTARFEEARGLLRQVLDKYCSFDEKERTGAQDKLKQAADLYEKLAKETNEFPLLTQEALMGTAKAKESLGDLDGALPFYQKLAAQKPETELTREADKSVKNLQDPATREKIAAFYKELQALNTHKTPASP